MARLVVSGEKPHTSAVELGELTIIGREPGVDVLIASEGVSRHHARISRGDEGYLLEDLWSRNGTFVNRRRVRRRTLHDGDQIDICEHSLVFHLEPEQEGRREVQPTMVFDEAPATGATALPITTFARSHRCCTFDVRYRTTRRREASTRSGPTRKTNGISAIARKST